MTGPACLSWAMQRYQGKRGTILGPGCRDQIKQRVAGRLRFGCRCRPASFWIGRNPEKAEGLTRAFSGHTKCASTACSRLGGARRKTRTSGLPSAIAGPFGAAPKRPLRVAPTRRSGAGASEGFPEDRLPKHAPIQLNRIVAHVVRHRPNVSLRLTATQ